MKSVKRKVLSFLLVLALVAGYIPEGLSMISAQASGTNTEQIAGNLIQNSSFETDSFGTAHGFNQWYTTTGTVNLSRSSQRHESGSHSLTVSNRTTYWHRAQYRVWFGSMTSGTEYELSGYVQAANETTVQLVANVWGYGGPAGNEYPCATMYLDTKTVSSSDWTKLAGNFTVTYTQSNVAGKQNALVTWGNEAVTLSAVSGVDCIEIMVQQTEDATNYPDLYMDSFLLEKAKEKQYPLGHAGGYNTEEDAQNVINNSSFETNDFTTGHNYTKWYPNTSGSAVLTQVDYYSQSGTHSLKVSNRKNYYDCAQYRVSSGLLTLGKEYTLSGYVSAAESTEVELLAIVWGTGGPEGNPYPSVNMTLDTGTANATSWTELAGNFVISTVPSSVGGKIDATVTWGDKTGTISEVTGITCVEFRIRQRSGATTYPDLYVDSFLMKANVKEEGTIYPSGHQNGTNTENIKYNLISNSSFETKDFLNAKNYGKWYKPAESFAVLTQFDKASQSGKNSLCVTNRKESSDGAGYSIARDNIYLGKNYNLSGYVCAETDTTVELVLEVKTYGGKESYYVTESVVLDVGDVGISEWIKLEGEFTIVKTANKSIPLKSDFTINYGNKSVVIEEIAGLEDIVVWVQESEHTKTDCPDLYLDSFILQNVSPKAQAPSGHSNAQNTELVKGNLINNGSFEKNDFAKEYVFDKWYTISGSTVNLSLDSAFSHSGKTSLKISGREEFWNRAEYRVEGGRVKLGHPYEISGYVAFAEDAKVDMYLQIWGYGGSEENPYPSATFMADWRAVAGRQWTKMSATIEITSEQTEDVGYYNFYISQEGSDIVYEIKHVKGLSAVDVLVQETYNEVKPRQDMWLDSFKMVDVMPKSDIPILKGHSNATNTELIAGNLIKNGGFEKNDFVHQNYVFEKWYTMEGVPATLTRDTTYSHSGTASLKISGRDTFWHRAEYRVEGGSITIGHPYDISGYVSFAEDAKVEFYLQVYGYGGPSNDPYPSVIIKADAKDAPATQWTKVSGNLTIKATKSSDAGYYDYTIILKGSDETYQLKHVKGISAIQMFVQEAYDAFTPHQDMYLDSFMMVDTVPKAVMPIPKGHTGAANTEDLEDNLINNSSFEADLFTNVANFGLWFTNGDDYDIKQVSEYSHSGTHSVRIYNRKSVNNTLVYKVEGGGIKLGTPYTLSGYVAAAQKTNAMLMLSVYGYAGSETNRTYPVKTITLSEKSVKDWTEFAGTFTITYVDGHLYLETAAGKVDIGECIGLSGIEFYVLTDETAENNTTDLYLDTFSLLVGTGSVVDDGDAVEVSEKGFGGDSGDSAEGLLGVETKNPYIIWMAVGAMAVLAGVGVVVFLARKSRKKNE